MQERNMIGFIKFSNNNSNETNKFLKFFKNQYVLLSIFYVSNFVYSFKNSADKGGQRLCGVYHNFSTNKSDFHLIPFAFWVFSLATLFWSYFGGVLDTCMHNLTENDLNFLKFIKLASILEFIEVVLNHVHITFTFGVYNSVLEMCLKEMNVIVIGKLIASVCSLTCLCLYFTFNNNFHSNYVIAVFQNLTTRKNNNKTDIDDTTSQSIYSSSNNNNNNNNNNYSVIINEDD